ncbi:hypothetical protein Agabi119p4_10124 [Agaricus bisporus var. burnettii]|uniref:Bromo domain-containing protein n=1 Tax=Agaricus bisporus var. burnettii TaxID=192524 RepID=A0A8H7C2B9_AGABI|nr:hypothetical protein Agabi119p4_10124 [Agaricus bisporus var. burnettii]
MDAALSPPSSSHSPLSSSRPTTTRSGLTLVLPSLKNLKAAKADKKTTQAAHIPQSPAIDVEGQEKKAPRPVKLKPLKEVLVKLIQQIKKKDDYAFFLEPVKVNLVPGYLDVIKCPMDFATMSNKVNRGKYRSLEEFANDLKLVTTNAKTFNPPGTIYYTEAERIEAWALDHIAKASPTVIQYETDWNIDIEKDDDTAVNIDDDDDDNPPTSIPADDVTVNGRFPSVTSQTQQTSGRRSTRGPYKKAASSTNVSESIDGDGRLPGSKDGLGAFPPCSDWAKTMVALKLKGKRYKTKKERLRFEKEGPPYLPDGSLDYSEMEDPFSILSSLVPDPLSRPRLNPIYPPISIPHAPSMQPTLSQMQSTSERSTPQPESSMRNPRSTFFPSTVNLPLNYDPSLSINHEVPSITTYPKRRHWQIIRNATGRKVKDNPDELETDELPWQTGREAHPADFGSFAVLAGALSEEMKRRGVDTKNGEEEKAVFDLIKESLEPVGVQDDEEGSEDVAMTAYTEASTVTANEYFTPQRAAEAEEYIRDVVYGGVDGFAYARSLAEFVSADPVEPQRHPSPSAPSELELGMSLVNYVQNIVDELTEGRHSLLRETAEHLQLLSLNPLTKVETNSVVADQTAASLHLVPQASIALQALLQIKLQKIDMSALINKPEELFLSEEEWAGKSLRVKRKEMEEKANVSVRKRAKASVDGDAMTLEENDEKQADRETCSNNGAFELEGPEELAGVLEYVANLIVVLNQRVSGITVGPHVVQASSEEHSDAITKLATPEDPTLRNLRLNLLALAKRAPLDMIARLPLELVPEHIRHYIPMLDSSSAPASTSSTGVSSPATSSPAISTIPTTTASPTSSNS